VSQVFGATSSQDFSIQLHDIYQSKLKWISFVEIIVPNI